MEHILITLINGNSNVGLFGYANDSYCLLGYEVRKKIAVEIGRVLKVPVIRFSVDRSSLVGIFVAGNNNKLLVPDIIKNDEIEILKNNNIPYEIIGTRFNAFGNNILCNDSGCIVSSDYSADVKKKIRQALGVPLKPGSIAGLDTVGALVVHNKKGCLIHRDVTEPEIEKIEEMLNLKCTEGTVNIGSPFVRAGILANSNGFVIGKASGGPEITNADEALGFLE